MAGIFFFSCAENKALTKSLFMIECFMSFSLIRYEGLRGFERVQGVGLKVQSLLYRF